MTGSGVGSGVGSMTGSGVGSGGETSPETTGGAMGRGDGFIGVFACPVAAPFTMSATQLKRSGRLALDSISIVNPYRLLSDTDPIWKCPTGVRVITGTHGYGRSNMTWILVSPGCIDICPAMSGSENITRDWNMTSFAKVTAFWK